MSNRSDFADVFKRLRRQGWSVTLRKRSGHMKLTPPSGGPSYFCSATPSDVRAVRKLRADLRRMGADL